jgi:hypothetical protein
MMWQRIPPPHSSEIGDRIPMCFSVQELPNEMLLSGLGVTDDTSVWGQTRDHPYSKWESVSFPKGTTLAQALVRLEAENSSRKRLAKIRLTFMDGVQLTLTRSNVRDPSSLHCSSVYHPSSVFLDRTQARSAASREELKKSNAFLSDAAGRITTGYNSSGKTFSAETLYRECPPPIHSQPSFDFTPMSYVSFYQRANVKVPGVRPDLTSTNPAAVHYRPRSFLRGDMSSRHSQCAEKVKLGDSNASVDLASLGRSVDHRNRLSPLRQRSVSAPRN